MVVTILITTYNIRSTIPDPSKISWVLSEFHEIFVKRPNGYPIIKPANIHAKLERGIGVYNKSSISITSITRLITIGIVSLASNFLCNRFLRRGDDTN
jgi:hypothetical protein